MSALEADAKDLQNFMSFPGEQKWWWEVSEHQGEWNADA